MNDMDRVILTDCDGVLVNWSYAFKMWMEHKGYEVESDEPADHYDVTTQYDLTAYQVADLITEFNASAAMGFLPPLRDAIHYVRKLHEDEGFVFHCITSMSTDKYAQQLRKMNLQKLFGDTVFEDFTFLATGAPKYDALRKYRNSGYLWIEDHIGNAVDGRKLGLDSIMMAHSYNKESHGIPRYAKWKDVYNRVVGE